MNQSKLPFMSLIANVTWQGVRSQGTWQGVHSQGRESSGKESVASHSALGQCSFCECWLASGPRFRSYPNRLHSAVREAGVASLIRRPGRPWSRTTSSGPDCQILAISSVGRMCASSGGRSAAVSGRSRIASASDAESASLSVAPSDALLLLVWLLASASWSAAVVVAHVEGHVYLRKQGMHVVMVRSWWRRFHSCSSRFVICGGLGSHPQPTAFL